MGAAAAPGTARHTIHRLELFGSFCFKTKRTKKHFNHSPPTIKAKVRRKTFYHLPHNIKAKVRRKESLSFNPSSSRQK
ncbi:MAG: hypothetical protein EA360_01845 [Balneolaceae bacterium]|nr:MAG: hypothetical protein EA360_01845 [Balneolaceae bacterium]